MPFSVAKKYLVYCAKCNEDRLATDRQRSQQRRGNAKRVKIGDEERKILDVVDKFGLNTLGLKAEQVKFVALKLPFLSQLVLAREAFHKKMSAFKKDTAWEPVSKEKKKTGSATTQRTNSRQKAMS